MYYSQRCSHFPLSSFFPPRPNSAIDLSSLKGSVASPVTATFPYLRTNYALPITKSRTLATRTHASLFHSRYSCLSSVLSEGSCGYCIASAMCSGMMPAVPPRSAIVLVTFSILSYARSLNPSFVIACLSKSSPPASGWQNSLISLLCPQDPCPEDALRDGTCLRS